MCVKNNTIIYVEWASNSKRDCEHDLYCCLLPRYEALRTCRSGFPIAIKYSLRFALPAFGSPLFCRIQHIWVCLWTTRKNVQTLAALAVPIFLILLLTLVQSADAEQQKQTYLECQLTKKSCLDVERIHGLQHLPRVTTSAVAAVLCGDCCYYQWKCITMIYFDKRFHARVLTHTSVSFCVRIKPSSWWSIGARTTNRGRSPHGVVHNEQQTTAILWNAKLPRRLGNNCLNIIGGNGDHVARRFGFLISVSLPSRNTWATRRDKICIKSKKEKKRWRRDTTLRIGGNAPFHE